MASSDQTVLQFFPSSTSLSAKVAFNIDYHHNMLVSHQKVNPKEVIVGWYSTGFGVSGGSALIHEFYSREVQNPVHLTVDTGFKNGEASIKAFVTVNLTLGDRQLAAYFQEVPLDLRMLEAEQVGWARAFLCCCSPKQLQQLQPDDEQAKNVVISLPY